MRRYACCLLLLTALCFVFSGSPMAAYADETEASEEETSETEEVAEEEEADSWAGKIWQSAIDLVKDYFIGPSYDQKPDISNIKDLEPYELLGGIAFQDDAAMKEVKGISASFYGLVSAVSVVGLISSFIFGGIAIALNRKKNKQDVASAILTKMLVFTVIFSITGLWGILIPLLKMITK